MAESDRRYTRAIVLHQHGVHENACRIAAWSSRCLPESHPSSIGAPEPKLCFSHRLYPVARGVSSPRLAAGG